MFVQRKYERDNDTQTYLQRKNERDSATQAYLQRNGERENAYTVGIAAVWAEVCAYTRTHCQRASGMFGLVRPFSPGVLQAKWRNIEKQWSISYKRVRRLT